MYKYSLGFPYFIGKNPNKTLNKLKFLLQFFINRSFSLRRWRSLRDEEIIKKTRDTVLVHKFLEFLRGKKSCIIMEYQVPTFIGPSFSPLQFIFNKCVGNGDHL